MQDAEAWSLERHFSQRREGVCPMALDPPGMGGWRPVQHQRAPA